MKVFASRIYKIWNQPTPSPNIRLVLLILLGAFIITPIIYFLPLLGYDWFRLFYAGFLDQYPPWMAPLFAPFRLLPPRWSLALVSSITLASVSTITFRQSRYGWKDGLMASLIALLSPPVLWILWDGQIDGLVLLCFYLLPWSIPVVLLRPQITVWVMLTRKKWTLAMVIWLLISFLIWGSWFLLSYSRSAGSISHPTAMGWVNLGWPVLLVGFGMFVTSGGNPWRTLAASFLLSPYVQPYHMTMLLPVLGRVHGRKRLILWLCVLMLGLVPAFLGITKYLALLFPILTWFFLRDDHSMSFEPPVPGESSEMS